MGANSNMDMYDIEAVNSRIREYMKIYGIRKKDLAEIVDKSPQRVSEILKENSGKSFHVEDLMRISKRFGVSMDIMLGNKPTDSSEICNIIIWLMENNLIRLTENSVSSSSSLGYDSLIDIESDSYPCLFFPFGWSEMFEDQTLEDGEPYTSRHFNFYRISENGSKVNAFLEQYSKLLTMYNEGRINEQQYSKGKTEAVKWVSGKNCVPERYLKLERKRNWIDHP